MGGEKNYWNCFYRVIGTMIIINQGYQCYLWELYLPFMSLSLRARGRIEQVKIRGRFFFQESASISICFNYLKKALVHELSHFRIFFLNKRESWARNFHLTMALKIIIKKTMLLSQIIFFQDASMLNFEK